MRTTADRTRMTLARILLRFWRTSLHALVAIVAAASVVLLLPAATANAASNPSSGCKEVHISRNVVAVASYVKKNYRLGAVNLKQYWCWDGSKVTLASDPVVWTSSAGAGVGTIQWKVNPAQKSDRDPQNGGFWTRQVVVTGSVDTCLVKYGCIGSRPFRLELSVFGDGVSYNATPGNIK